MKTDDKRQKKKEEGRKNHGENKKGRKGLKIGLSMNISGKKEECTICSGLHYWIPLWTEHFRASILAPITSFRLAAFMINIKSSNQSLNNDNEFLRDKPGVSCLLV